MCGAIPPSSWTHLVYGRYDGEILQIRQLAWQMMGWHTASGAQLIHIVQRKEMGLNTIHKKVSGTTKNINRDRESSVSIATGYGLDGPEIESRWGRDFPRPSRAALGPTQPPRHRVPGRSRGVKRPGRGVDQSPTSSAEVKERVELYLYSASGPSWLVLWWTLPLSLPYKEYKYLITCNKKPAEISSWNY
jgi:hypothetical protein